jgi:acetate kinase
MKILVVNLGSTSLKYRLFELGGGQGAQAETERLLAKGGQERVSDHGAAIDACLEALAEGGFVRGPGDLAAVAFKAVLARGVTGCVRVDERVLAAMEAYRGLAPAHNPPYVAGMRAFARRLPDTPLVALFETAFYQWVPEAGVRYAVPDAWHEAGVRRFGFHGASHKYVAERSAELLGRPDVAARARNLYVDGPRTPLDGPDLRVVSCHLGGSASVTGIRSGVAVGTSMGMSPQSGLPQNDRVGDLDAMAVPYAMRTLGLSLDQAERALTKEGGLKALSGGKNDLRDIEEAAAQGDARARLALEVLVRDTRRWIGAFLLELDGLDALVFTAGIGENAPAVRAGVCAGLSRMGLSLDAERNGRALGVEAEISADGSPVKVLVVPTNEELVVAREARRLLALRQAQGERYAAERS